MSPTIRIKWSRVVFTQTFHSHHITRTQRLIRVHENPYIFLQKINPRCVIFECNWAVIPLGQYFFMFRFQ